MPWFSNIFGGVAWIQLWSGDFKGALTPAPEWTEIYIGQWAWNELRFISDSGLGMGWDLYRTADSEWTEIYIGQRTRNELRFISDSGLGMNWDLYRTVGSEWTEIYIGQRRFIDLPVALTPDYPGSGLSAKMQCDGLAVLTKHYKTPISP